RRDRGLRRHVHLLRGVHDVHLRVLEMGVPEGGADLARVADEGEPEAAGPFAERERGARSHGRGAEVASHRINPDARDRGHGVAGRLRFARRDDLFAPVVPAARADAVWEPRGAAVSAVREARFAELPVRAPLLAARVRVTSLGYRHDAGPPEAQAGA